jgi:hypothetical protein
MSYYYFEVVVEVKKENASILQTHSNIRASNMFDALQWIWLKYIGKNYISKNMRLIYGELQINNACCIARTPLDFEIKSVRCVQIVDDKNDKDYEESTVRTEFTSLETVKTIKDESCLIEKSC